MLNSNPVSAVVGYANGSLARTAGTQRLALQPHRVVLKGTNTSRTTSGGEGEEVTDRNNSSSIDASLGHLRSAVRLQLSEPLKEDLNALPDKGLLLHLLSEVVSEWRKNPKAVHPSWKEFLRDNVGQKRFSLSPHFKLTNADPVGTTVLPPGGDPEDVTAAVKAISMIRHFQKNGHFTAAVDPLHLPMHPPYITRTRYEAIHSMTSGALETFQFEEKDLERPIFIRLPATGGFLGDWNLCEADRLSHLAGKYVSLIPPPLQEPLKLKDLYRRLREVYTGPIGIEFLHIFDRNKINWIRNHFETPEKPQFSKEMKLKVSRL